jgi:hypothetical protein
MMTSGMMTSGEVMRTVALLCEIDSQRISKSALEYVVHAAMCAREAI